jgi:hypothetical protein
VLTSVVARLWCQSPKKIHVSAPAAFASSQNHLTKSSQSMLCDLLPDFIPKWISVKQAAFLNNGIFNSLLYCNGNIDKSQDFFFSPRGAVSPLSRSAFWRVQLGFIPFISKISSLIFWFRFSILMIRTNELVTAAV